MTNEFWKGVAAGLIRLLLAGVAGYLVREGAVTGPQWEIIVGVLASVTVALLWSIIQKYKVDELIGTALRMPEHATREQLNLVSKGGATVDVFKKTAAPCLLVVCLLAASVGQTACGGRVSREELVKVAGYGRQLEAQLFANETVPRSLFDQGLITRERLDFLAEHVGSAKRLVTAFNDRMSAALATEKPDVRSLVSLAGDMVAEVQLIARGASPEWKKALAVIEISLRAIASYFASQVAAFRGRFGRGADRMLARHFDLAAARAVEDYAAGR